MRDLVYFGHLILGISVVVASFLVIRGIKTKASWVKPLSALTATISWLLLLPSSILYITFYPATKTLVKAGSWPWAHSIIMETKEHWGILLPLFVTVAALMVYNGKTEESKKWWILILVVSVLIAVMGRIIKMGALA